MCLCPPIAFDIAWLSLPLASAGCWRTSLRPARPCRVRPRCDAGGWQRALGEGGEEEKEWSVKLRCGERKE